VLAAAEVGTGPSGVLLVPESGPRGLCGWWQYAVYLAGRGFHVLLFDQRCSGESPCPGGPGGPGPLIQDVVAAAQTLHTDGARHIVLVGAARGGAEVIVAGARAAAGDRSLSAVSAVAAFSPDLLDDPMAGPPLATANQAAARLPLAALIAVAPGDHDAPVPDVQRLYQAIPAADKHLFVVSDQPGVHGWTLLTPDRATARPPRVSTTLVAFLQKYTR
jgi:pimeloyl-ACP methyl ester carboxylesterase